MVGGGVEVLGHGINRPRMHGLKRRRGCVSDLFGPNYGGKGERERERPDGNVSVFK